MLKLAPVSSPKPPLSSQFAWVIGVEALSSYFADVPRYDDLQVWFSDRPLEYRWTMQKIAAEKRSYQILTLWYSAARRDPRWYFMVYPIERHLKSSAQELLESKGMPWIHHWLTSEQNETEMISSHHLRCIFHPPDRGLTLEHEKG